MKWILAILLLISVATFGQVGRGDDSTKYIRYQNQYGQRMPRSWWDSVAHMPYGDTSTFPKPCRPGAIMMHTDKNFYKWNGGGWEGMSGSGGATTLSNQGSGYRLVKTADGQIKTLFGGYGINADSSSNTDAITFKADTSSTNHLVTQSDLNDSSAAIRAYAGAPQSLDEVLAIGNKGFNKDLEIHDSKNSQAVIAIYNRDTTNDNAVARIDARAYRGKAVLTVQGGSHAFNGFQIYRYTQPTGAYLPYTDSVKTFEFQQVPDVYGTAQLRNGIQMHFVHPNYDGGLMNFDTTGRIGLRNVDAPKAWLDIPPGVGSGYATLRLQPTSFSANTDAGAIDNTGTFLQYIDNSHVTWNLNDQCHNAIDGTYSAPSHSFTNAPDAGMSYNNTLDAPVLSAHGAGVTMGLINTDASGYSGFAFMNNSFSQQGFVGFNNAVSRFRIGANSGFSLDFEAGGFNDNDPTMRLTSSGGVYMKTLVGTGTRVVTVDASGNLAAGQALSATPTVSTGTAAPSSTPAKVGDIYVDTSNKKLYFAAGTSSSSDWIIAN